MQTPIHALVQKAKLPFISAIFIMLISVSAHAGWGDMLKDLLTGDDASGSSSGTVAALSNSDIVGGLKDALSVSTKKAIQSLGRTDGFFGNANVKIPMPDKLQSVESALRKLGQDKYADEFVLTMNRAAEQAVPETANIFADAIQQMSFDDARGILNGPEDSTTRYFRDTSGVKLSERILPIVQAATANAGVTNSYKSLIDNLGFMKNVVDVESLDLDKYVTEKAVDGLFTMLAEQEKLIRENPAARTTDLLKKVFSS